MKDVLEIKNLKKSYKNAPVLGGVDMHVPRGSIYGLIGKNGAGKTTLMRIITSLQEPSGGTYKIMGVDYRDSEIFEVRKRIGALVEKAAIYENLSARDNLILEFKLVGNPDFERIEEILELVGLKDTKKPVRKYSLGMKQRLGIALSLAGNPDILILDEPINGLDPEGIIEVRELLLNLNRNKNITILVSSHYLDELSKIATCYGFLDNGRIVREVSSEEIKCKMETRLELKVDNVKNFVKFLEKNKYSYKVMSDERIDVYGQINISKFVLDLSKAGLEVEEIHEREAALESYYMNLIGDEKND